MPSSRCIVLTGATRGLGRSLVREFANRGHTVLGCGRSSEGVERLRRDFPEPHEFRVVDVVQEDQVRAWAEDLLTRHTPYLLLNNAGVMNHPAPLWEVPTEEFDSLIDINIKGVTNVLRCFLPAMIASKQGVVVNFSSTWGRSTSSEVAPYCASKWAIEGLTRALAQELPSGLAAISLNPGVINTDMLRICFVSSASHYPTAEEWAERAAPFLLKLGPRDNGKPLTVS